MDPQVHELVAREASRLGVSVSHFLEVAGLARAAISAASRLTPEGIAIREEVYAAAAAALRRGDVPDGSTSAIVGTALLPRTPAGP